MARLIFFGRIDRTSPQLINDSGKVLPQPSDSVTIQLRREYSPPPRGGVDATSRKYREASFEERTGWSLTSHISECVLNTACERPPRLRRFGGFATSS